MHALSATTPADDVAEILLTAEEIAAKVKELGTEIARDYRGKDVVFVSILKGALPFLADLMRAEHVSIEMPRFLEITDHPQHRDLDSLSREFVLHGWSLLRS